MLPFGLRKYPAFDYDATFAPVVKFSCACVFLATFPLYDLKPHEMDVVPAFLHGDIDKDIYMLPMAGFGDPHHPHLV